MQKITAFWTLRLENNNCRKCRSRDTLKEGFLVSYQSEQWFSAVLKINFIFLQVGISISTKSFSLKNKALSFKISERRRLFNTIKYIGLKKFLIFRLEIEDISNFKHFTFISIISFIWTKRLKCSNFLTIIKSWLFEIQKCAKNLECAS